MAGPVFAHSLPRLMQQGGGVAFAPAALMRSEQSRCEIESALAESWLLNSHEYRSFVNLILICLVFIIELC
jgi:hypothetical protein